MFRLLNQFSKLAQRINTEIGNNKNKNLNKNDKRALINNRQPIKRKNDGIEPKLKKEDNIRYKKYIHPKI